MHLALLLEMYRIGKAGVALKMISETFQLQEEANYNFRYTSQFYFLTAILKFTAT